MPNSPSTFRSKQTKQAAQKQRGTKQARGYGGEWERISLLVRAQNPVCQICHNAPSEHTDHIIPFKGVLDPLRTDHDNLQAVCAACHLQKTLQDARKRAKRGNN